MGPKAHRALSATGLIKVLGQNSVAHPGGKKGANIAAHPSEVHRRDLVTRQAQSPQPVGRLTAKPLTFLAPLCKEHAHW